MLSNKIGNYPASHPLAVYRCKQIADNVKFISDYERVHNIKLDRERGDLKHFFGRLHAIHQASLAMMQLNTVSVIISTVRMLKILL